MIKRHFIPSHYYKQLYQHLQNLTRGSKNVEDYHKEMEMAMTKANIEEDKEAIMVRFLAGLNRDIWYIVKLQHYMELKDLVHLAMKVEK